MTLVKEALWFLGFLTSALLWRWMWEGFGPLTERQVGMCLAVNAVIWLFLMICNLNAEVRKLRDRTNERHA